MLALTRRVPRVHGWAAVEEAVIHMICRLRWVRSNSVYITLGAHVPTRNPVAPLLSSLPLHRTKLHSGEHIP